MSAYGHEMEREFSTQSLSTRVGSEMGSRFTTEGGLFISSFAATVFISGIVTAGVCLVSLLVSLIVMLQSCEKGNSHVIELYRYNYTCDYCQNFALHAELNRLDADSFPAVCKDVAVQYIEEGQYMRDLNTTVSIIEDFFNSARPADDGRDVVLMDADDIIASETLEANLSTNLINNVFHGSTKDAKYLKHIFVVKLYKKLRFDGWSITLLSRKPEKLGNATVEYLKSIGCSGWSSLFMRMENETHMDSQELLTRRRTTLKRDGYRIKAVISSQMDALMGPYLGDRIFKTPNPIFGYSMDRVERTIQEK